MTELAKMYQMFGVKVTYTRISRWRVREILTVCSYWTIYIVWRPLVVVLEKKTKRLKWDRTCFDWLREEKHVQEEN